MVSSYCWYRMIIDLAKTFCSGFSCFLPCVIIYTKVVRMFPVLSFSIIAVFILWPVIRNSQPALSTPSIQYDYAPIKLKPKTLRTPNAGESGAIRAHSLLVER